MQDLCCPAAAALNRLHRLRGVQTAAGSTKEAVAGSEGNAMFHEALNLAGVPVKQRRVQRGSML